jgi:hypothetical protein
MEKSARPTTRVLGDFLLDTLSPQEHLLIKKNPALLGRELYWQIYYLPNARPPPT